MIRSRTLACALVLGMAAAAWAAAPSTSTRAASTSQTVATVGPVPVTRAEFEARYRLAEQDHRTRNQTDVSEDLRPLLRRQVLEGLIRERILILEARRRGTPVSDAEAEAMLRTDPAFQRAGRFDEKAYATARGTQPEAFRAALEKARVVIAAQRLKQSLEKEQTPADTVIHQNLSRRSTAATIEFLRLRRPEFATGAREPSERELLADLREHGRNRRNPEEARVSVVFVNQPPLADSLMHDPDARREWVTRMRQRADSVIAGVRGGAALEDLAEPFGGVKHAVLRRDSYPGFWKGAPRHNQAVFALGEGALLQEPVPGQPGWVVARLDRSVPEGPAPLTHVVPEARLELRQRASAARDEALLRQIYASVRDSLAGPAWNVRYAVIELGIEPTPEPSAAEVERAYREHRADYSIFEPVAGTVVTRPLSEVRGEVIERLRSDRADALSTAAARRLLESWKARRRPRAERGVEIRGPLLAPVGSLVDTGWAAAALSETLKVRPQLPGTGMVRTERGWVVYEMLGLESRGVPTLEQARPNLRGRLEAARRDQEEAEARAWFERDPSRFDAGELVYFTRIIVPPVDILDAPVTRAEAERYYRLNLADFTAPQSIEARHILLIPEGSSAAEDSAALRLAQELASRARAGERVFDLARLHSLDLETRDQGGNLGELHPGSMWPEFERVAFRLRPGEIGGPVRTSVGYHIIECMRSTPSQVTPLRHCYSNVAAAVATLKADSLSRVRAEGLRAGVTTPRQALALAGKSNLFTLPGSLPVSARKDADEGFLAMLLQQKPGQLSPGVMPYRGGHMISWVDSFARAPRPVWNDLRSQLMDRFRRERALQSVAAKAAELDSMTRAGWSWDSLATLWGGWQEMPDIASGTEFPEMKGTRPVLDSLVFGRTGAPPVLSPGEISSWVHLEEGSVRVRLLERRQPNAVELRPRIEQERRLELERRMRKVYEGLARRHPIRILDPELRGVSLPALPES